MRLKGIDPENAPESVKPIFQGSLDLFGRVITPNGDRCCNHSRRPSQDNGVSARGADGRLSLLSGYQLCRGQRRRDH